MPNDPAYLSLSPVTWQNPLQGSAVATKTINIRDEVESSPEEILNEMEEEHQETVRVMAGSPHLYRDLANSLAPGVHGHEDVKRSILLMLLGGVHKKTAEVCICFCEYSAACGE